MKIFLIDHHVLFREGLKSLLENESGLKVVGGTGLLSKAAEMVLEAEPDLVIMDLDPYADDGLEAIREILTRAPETQIILLTNHEPDEIFKTAIRSGVKGYIEKNSTFEEVLASIRAVDRGEAALSRKMTRKVLDLFFGAAQINNDPGNGLSSLTPRELEVLHYLSDGNSNRRIAEELVISENTVKIHVHNILDKLELRNRREAASYARQHGVNYP